MNEHSWPQLTGTFEPLMNSLKSHYPTSSCYSLHLRTRAKSGHTKATIKPTHRWKFPLLRQTGHVCMTWILLSIKPTKKSITYSSVIRQINYIIWFVLWLYLGNKIALFGGTKHFNCSTFLFFSKGNLGFQHCCGSAASEYQLWAKTLPAYIIR